MRRRCSVEIAIINNPRSNQDARRIKTANGVVPTHRHHRRGRRGDGSRRRAPEPRVQAGEREKREVGDEARVMSLVGDARCLMHFLSKAPPSSFASPSSSTNSHPLPLFSMTVAILPPGVSIVSTGILFTKSLTYRILKKTGSLSCSSSALQKIDTGLRG